MKTVHQYLPLLSTASLVLVLTGCIVERRGYGHRHVVVRETVVAPAPGTEVIVTQAPPPFIVEEVVVRPGPAYVWVPGYYVWNGRWVWERGHWVIPPRRGAVWVPHRYVYRGGAHVYVHGGWR